MIQASKQLEVQQRTAAPDIAKHGSRITPTKAGSRKEALMARPGSEHPTELELEILKVLWHESPLLVRDVRLRLETEANRPLAHTSVITILNIMYHKGFLRRTKQGKSFLFSPKVKRGDISRRMVGDMLSRLFNGSPTALMLNLLDTTNVDTEEFNSLKKIITQKMKEQGQ